MVDTKVFALFRHGMSAGEHRQRDRTQRDSLERDSPERDSPAPLQGTVWKRGSVFRSDFARVVR